MGRWWRPEPWRSRLIQLPRRTRPFPLSWPLCPSAPAASCARDPCDSLDQPVVVLAGDGGAHIITPNRGGSFQNPAYAGLPYKAEQQKLNLLVQQLAPVLNTQSTLWNFGDGIDRCGGAGSTVHGGGSRRGF